MLEEETQSYREDCERPGWKGRDQRERSMRKWGKLKKKNKKATKTLTGIWELLVFAFFPKGTVAASSVVLTEKCRVEAAARGEIL